MRRPGSSTRAHGPTGTTGSDWPPWGKCRRCRRGASDESPLHAAHGGFAGRAAAAVAGPAARDRSRVHAVRRHRAIALRLGHRDSVDFDFFTDAPLDRDAIRAACPFVAQALTLQDQSDTWVMLVPAGDGEQVKVSFFGTIAFGRVGEPDFTEDGVLQVAAMDDLMATKVKVVLQRAEAKDYRDVAAMVNAGVSLSRRLASAACCSAQTSSPAKA
ncbi:MULTISPECIES: nucleotidyl transferase AbiEii/AbiGii toxin family protein [Cupriavidus]